MTVERLKPREAFAKYGAKPRRPRLAELKRQIDANAAETAAAELPHNERAAAIGQLSTAEGRFSRLLMDAALGVGDDDAIAASKAEVLRLRATAAGADLSAKIAGLHAEAARLADAFQAEIEAAELAGLTEVIAYFQFHAKSAQVGAAAIEALRAAAAASGHQRIVDATTNALDLHRDPVEAGQRKLMLNKVLATVRAAWTAWPAALQGDPEAQPAPLSEAVALLPVRTEEQDVADAA